MASQNERKIVNFLLSKVLYPEVDAVMWLPDLPSGIKNLFPRLLEVHLSDSTLRAISLLKKAAFPKSYPIPSND